MAPRAERRGLLGLLAAAACLAACLSWRGLAGASGDAAAPRGFVAGRRPQLLQRPRPLEGLRARKGPPEPVTKEREYKINEEIRFTEVRLVGEVMDSKNVTDIQEVNEVLLTSEALARAKSRGLDLVLINEDPDPPLVKITNVGKYTYQQQRMEKEKQRSSKAPKMKEVRLSYTIGDHDLNVKVKQIKSWLQNKKQQVKVVVQMRGRSRMFEKQSRALLQRLQIEISGFAKAQSSAKTGDAVSKDGQGSLVMMLAAGADTKLTKVLKEQLKAQLEEAADYEQDEDDPVVASTPKAKGGAVAESPELQELQEELEEVKQDLLDCGINPGQLAQQPEFVDVLQRIEEAKAKIGASALGGRGALAASGVLPAASFALAAASLLVGARRPSRAQVRGRSLR